MLRKFISDSFVYAIPTFVSKGMALLFVPIFTRVLKPADYGAIDLIMLFANIVNLTIALEISQALARFYMMDSDARHKVEYTSTAFWFTLAIYSVFLVIGSLLSREMAWLLFENISFSYVFRLSLLFIWLSGIYNLMLNQFRWEFKSIHFAFINVLMAITMPIISVIMVYQFNCGIDGMILGMIFSHIVGVAYGCVNLRKSVKFLFCKKKLVEMLIFSAPLVPSSVAVWVVNYIDRLMITHSLGLEAVGVYGIGFRVANVVALVVSSFQCAIIPLIYAHCREHNAAKQIASVFHLFIIISLSMFVGLSLFSIEIVKLLAPPEYYQAATVVPFLALSVLFSQMYVFAPGMVIEKKTLWILLINILGALLAALLNLLMIPLFGLNGAGMAMLISSSVVFVCNIYVSQKLYYIPYDWARVFLLVFFAVLIYFVNFIFAGDIFVRVLFFLFTLSLMLYFVDKLSIVAVRRIFVNDL